jgi:hypothetical protein
MIDPALAMTLSPHTRSKAVQDSSQHMPELEMEGTVASDGRTSRYMQPEPGRDPEKQTRIDFISVMTEFQFLT